MADAEQVWIRRPSLVWRKVGEEAVILDPDQRVLRGLNDSGWRVWELLDGSHTVADIARDLASHFRIPETRAAEDLAALLRDLERAELIERKQ
jgi:hypothetical protein